MLVRTVFACDLKQGGGDLIWLMKVIVQTNAQEYGESQGGGRYGQNKTAKN